MTLWRWFFPKKQEKEANLEQQESDDEAEDTVDVLPPKPVQQESESDWGMGKYPLYNEAATTHTLTEMEDENSDDSSFNSNTVPQTLSSLLTTKAFRKSVSTSNLQRMNSKSVVIDFNHFAAPSRLLSYKTNPFNEFHMLQGHKDIVRQVMSLHSEYSTQTTTWIASSGDDDNIIIWDWFYARKIYVLEGHRSPVTCMCLLPNMTLLSGSCDKTIKMWDLSDGKCVKTLHEHSKGVKRICILDEKRFCSGGNDDKLCIWSFEGELLDVIERVEDENIHEILVLPNNNIITASDNKNLHVYNTKSMTATEHKLEYHTDSVQCLVYLNDSYFASASLDGSIIIWDTVKLTMVKKLEQHKTDKTLTKIHDLLVINKNFLAVAVQNGFCIYDWETNKMVMQEKQAHNAACRKLIALHQGNVIVSCSDDCKLRVWYTQHRFTDKYGTPQAPSVATPVKTPTTTSTTSEKKSDEILSPKFIGELEVHVKSINDLLYLSDYHFASCSADGTVLIWKDGRIERRLRLVLASLYNSYGFRAKDVLKQTMTRLNTTQLRSLHRVTSNADSMDTDADENV